MSTASAPSSPAVPVRLGRSSPESGCRVRAALVTGSAGFIGFHLARRLLEAGWSVTGIDAMTPYYDVRLKERRRLELARHARYRHVTARIEEPGRLAALMAEARPEIVLHLAAQAGVRHSLKAPETYLEANLAGTFHLLEALRAHPPRHAILASSSSVYGAGQGRPYGETGPADHPLSFYAATKKASETLAHSYAHLHGLPITMARFFTVYGPWGRPDMALFGFVEAMSEGRAIELFNGGALRRDFTYVDDLVEGLVRLADAAPKAGAPVGPMDSLSPVAPFRIVNIGRGQPVALLDFVAEIERATGLAAHRLLRPMQPGDTAETWADTSLLTALVGPLPRTPLSDGLAAFVDWYRRTYRPAEGRPMPRGSVAAGPAAAHHGNASLSLVGTG